jgi:hypothetical protein
VSRRIVSRASRLIGLGLFCACMAAGRASAQAWSAQLVLAPMPSPYLSDWELDPTIGQLIVTNPGSAATDVTFHYTVTHNGKMLLRGTTDPLTIPGQQSVVFTGASTFGGRADWDRDAQQTIARTGKLPEGEYEGCVTLLGPGRIVLVERQCARFNTQSSDPPFLVSPANGDTLASRDPIFEWQPVQVPPSADVRVAYVLQIAEVRTAAGQRPEVALESNILHYVEPNLVQTSHQYPVGALPLVSGRTYAWRVQALDGDGKPAATNQGRSEIWTFVYRETETEVARAIARLELTPRRDTLRFAGDTARYEVTAYDTDNVEVTGKRIDWRSLDTTIVRVDSTGNVTGVAPGETRIVASVGGIADSAVSVTSVDANLAVGFESYDGRTDKPALLELINSGSFEEVLPRLMELLRSGEFRIPIPRLPSAPASNGGDDAQGNEATSRQSGPHMPGGVTGGRTAITACEGEKFRIEFPHVDFARQAIAFYVPLNRTQRQALMGCLGSVPTDDEELSDVEAQRGAFYLISFLHPGLPRAFIAIKGPGFGLTLLGPKVRTRYLVINPTRPLTVDTVIVPKTLHAFLGGDSFEAGMGVTYYSVRTCVESSGPLCPVLRWINAENPDITIQAFAGITASETSVQGGSKGLAAGTSLALGFSIQATLPVRRWGNGVGGLTLDSTQVGLMFAGQDSIVAATGGGSGNNFSVSVSPTITVWWSKAGGNSWEFSGSIGLEVDPSKGRQQVPKLVVAGQIPSVWKLWNVRLGNPQIVFTRMLEENGTMDLGLSGTWGAGPWNGNPDDAVGVETGGGGVRGDAGGASIGGTSGFEELGRGAVILKWEKRTNLTTAPPTASDVADAKNTLADAKTRHQALEAEAKGLEQKCVDLRRRFDASLERREPSPFVQQDRDTTCAAAHSKREETLKALSAEHQASTANRAIRQAGKAADACPAGASLTSDGRRCYSWTAQLSLGNGAIVDLISLVVRNWRDSQ